MEAGKKEGPKFDDVECLMYVIPPQARIQEGLDAGRKKIIHPTVMLKTLLDTRPYAWYDRS